MGEKRISHLAHPLPYASHADLMPLKPKYLFWRNLMKLTYKVFIALAIVVAGLLLASPSSAQNGKRTRAGQPAATQTTPCPNGGANEQCQGGGRGYGWGRGQGQCNGTGQRVRARDGSGPGYGRGNGGQCPGAGVCDGTGPKGRGFRGGR
jgi:hypothetical protein